jgi:hypothetical protein
MSVEEDQIRVGDIEGKEMETTEAPHAPIATEEEAPDFELGDHVHILGGRLDGTRGRIYYLDEDLIRILPDGVSDRLVELTFVEDPEFGKDLDPKLGIEHFYLVSKRATPAFVAQIDARVGQIADTFGINGEPGIQYTVKAVDESEDTITLIDETGGEKEIQFEFRGIPQEEPFAVLRPRDPAGAVNEAAAEAEAEATAAEEEGFEFLEELEEEIKGIQETPSTQLFYPDIVQRNDMFRSFLEALPLPSQKNPKQQRDVRRIVELCMLLRNEAVSYAVSGEPDGRLRTSFETIGELLNAATVALSRPVLDVKRTLYMDHSRDADEIPDPTEIPGRKLEVQYLEDIVRDSTEFAEGELSGIQGQALDAEALPAWYTGWERFYKQYLRTWSDDGSVGERIVFGGDKEFLRADFTDGLDPDTDALAVLGPTMSGKDIIRQVPPAGLTQVAMSVMKGLGPRATRIKEREARRIETGDEAVVVGQLLFPLSAERDLGATRTGRLLKDIEFSTTPPRSIKRIITDLSGVQEDATTGGILSMGPTGNTTGAIAIAEWIRSQPLYINGMADAMVDLKSMGMSQKEFTNDQQEVLLEKLGQMRALLKQYIVEERQLAVKALGELRLQNKTFLEGEALEKFMAVLAEEPLLAARAAEIRARIPAYKDNDIAMTAGMMDSMSNLFLTAYAGVPAPLARERHRRVRDQFLEALRIGLAKATKRANAGVEPQPNKCPHVASLNAIRKIKDPLERILTMARLIARFKGGRLDNWLSCAICNQHLLCYHEELQMQEFIRPREKEILHKELLLTFSGGVFQGKYMCKNCGQGINDVELDQGLEYDDSGKPMMGRAVLVDKDARAEEDMEMLLGGPAEAPEELQFKTEVQTLIYKTARQIFDRVGIYADSDSYSRLVERVESEIQKQPSREQYAKRVAEKKTQGVKSVDYDVLINRILVSATGAHALIEVQTHIPGYVLRTKLAGCRAGFTGYPLGSEKDRTGIEYISCAIAGLKLNEAPWNLTGFLKESSDKKRQELIVKSIESLVAEALKTALVQQRMTDKRAYLERLYGSAEFAERLPEAIPSGFYPVPYAISEKDAAETVVVPAAATPQEIARAWIQTSHRYARQFGSYVRGSPYSEASCCYAVVDDPRRFWAEKENAMPPLSARTPPRGRASAELTLPFRPRPAARLFPELPEDLYYRVFLRVCYDGPRKGLPHEPGYTHTCPWCGFVFPESPYTESPAPPQGKELLKDWQAEIDGILTKGRAALQTQNVVITKATFEDVLDAAHNACKVPKVVLARPVAGIDLFVRLMEMQPEPFEGWRAIMAATMEKVSRLPPVAQEIDVAEAYGPLSNAAVEDYNELGRRIGAKSVDALRGVLQQSPGQIAESLRTYLLVPFQRLIVRFKVTSLRVQKGYDLSTGTKDDIHRALEAHLGYLDSLSKRVAGFTLAKLQQARDRLALVLPILKEEVRATFLPGGQFGLSYLVSCLILGILSEFIDPNRVPQSTTEGITVDAGARAPIQVLDICLGRLQIEGLNFTEQQIRDMIARRAEAEKVAMIGRIASMTPEEKKVELMKKRLGLGEWAVGGTKAIYAYDPEQYERERGQREVMGLAEFGAVAGAPDEDYGGGGAGAEGGYDAEQMAADDY